MTAVQLAMVRLEDVPGDDAWLTVRESEAQRSFSHPARRSSWRAGRFAAKQLFSEPWLDIEVLAGPDGAPRVFRKGRACREVLSLSHRAGWAAAAAAHPKADVAIDDAPELGVDLEWIEPRTERFVQDFFTETEAQCHRRAAQLVKDRFAVLVWSAKEAALKCARTGLRRDTRSVEVCEPDRLVAVLAADASGGGVEGNWRKLAVFDRERSRTLHGRWTSYGRLVVTVLHSTDL